MEKKKFYVNMGTQEVSQIKYGNNQDFIIHATEEEVILLREKLNDMDQANTRAFFRAHVPIMSYHNDKSNDDYDGGMTGAYQMLYDLGDEEAKEHIESMGILSDRHL
ncbi:hydrolase [Virgibacillus necropolis]|uniref:hydrolase n=1 Tax=Virgibacillus necropolis TaxID=163877 RepID=UPI0038509BCF